jgi:acyl-CoA thioesterase FadM
VLREGELLVTGHTRHACIDLATGKPVRMPAELFELAPDLP